MYFSPGYFNKDRTDYRSEDGLKKSSIFTNLFFFYLKLFAFILKGNRLVRRGLYDDAAWVQSSISIMRECEKLGVRFNVEGIENIYSVNGPVVFIANHMSTLETVILPVLIHPIKKVCFVTKKELTDYPVFGPVNSARDPIIVGRTNPRDDLKIVMEEGAERFNRGISVILFPQRTRSMEFEPSKFNSLGIKLAKRNNIPVIPIAILSDAWENGKIVKEFGKIDTSKEAFFSFGKPLEITGNGSGEHQQVIDFITSKLISWNRSHFIKE